MTSSSSSAPTFTIKKNLPPAAYFHPLTLLFKDPQAEKAFNAYIAQYALLYLRYSYLAGILLWILFGILDHILIKERLHDVWLIRYGIGLPLIMISFAAAFIPRLYTRSYLFAALTMLSSGLAVVAMIAVADSPANNLYYVGIVVSLLYCAYLISSKTVFLVPISLFVLICYEITIFYINPLPMAYIINNNFFLIMAVGVAVKKSYDRERFIRLNFINESLAHATNIELHHANEALAQQKQVAEESSAAKSNFLAMMSHELRTPLQGIQGYAELLQMLLMMESSPTQHKKLHYLKNITDSVAHQLTIVNDVLRFSRGEAEKIVLQEVYFSMGSLIEEAIRLTENNAQSRNINVQFHNDTDLSLWADRQLILQCVINVLANAIKFSHENDSITIEVQQDQQNITVAVIDRGIGIPEAEQTRIFEPFAQVQNSYTREHDGTGLGLPFVRKIMRLHNGEVTVKSTSNQGATFYLNFPANRLQEITQASV